MYGDNVSVVLDEVNLHSSQYHITEFAKKYFREAQGDQRSLTKHTAESMLKQLHF